MRLDFRQFSISGPTVHPTRAYQSCNDEYLQVGNVTLCGENTGQHSKFDGVEKSPTTFNLLVLSLRSDKSETGRATAHNHHQHEKWKWKWGTPQLEHCGPSIWVPTRSIEIIEGCRLSSRKSPESHSSNFSFRLAGTGRLLAIFCRANRSNWQLQLQQWCRSVTSGWIKFELSAWRCLFRALHRWHELRNLLPSSAWQSINQVRLQPFTRCTISLEYLADSSRPFSEWTLATRPTQTTLPTLAAKAWILTVSLRLERQAVPKISCSSPTLKLKKSHRFVHVCSAGKVSPHGLLSARQLGPSHWLSIPIKFTRQQTKLDSECNTKLFKHVNCRISLSFFSVFRAGNLHANECRGKSNKSLIPNLIQ